MTDGSDNHNKETFPTIPSSNKNGKSAKIQFHIIPEVKRECDVYLKNLPYATLSDLYRHAIVRHIEYLATVSVEPTEHEYVRSLLDFLGREKERVDYQLVLDELDEVVGGHIKKERTRDARRAVRIVMEAVWKMPDGNLKDNYREQINNKFGGLINMDLHASITYNSDPIDVGPTNWLSSIPTGVNLDPDLAEDE